MILKCVEGEKEMEEKCLYFILCMFKLLSHIITIISLITVVNTVDVDYVIYLSIYVCYLTFGWTLKYCKKTFRI